MENQKTLLGTKASPISAYGGPESRRGKSVLAFRFPKLRQGVLFNNIHIELLSEKSYNHSTNVQNNTNQPERICEK
jgi:hypothetical protein